MRDAFGGSFMLKMMLVFIFIFVYFIAIALNYAKAFRIKNDIIDYLEVSQVNLFNDNYVEIDKAENDIMNILKKYNYKYVCQNNATSKCIGGVEIVKHDENFGIKGVNYAYYDVYVRISYDLGFLKLLLSLTNTTDNNSYVGTWCISGQTKTIISA